MTLVAADHPSLAWHEDLDLARALVRAVAAEDPPVAEARDRILAHAAGSDAALRSARPGHLTGSALVVDHDGTHLVLLHHAKLRRWLQPGGHADGDANLAAVALREATEETGIVGLRIDPEPVDLDVHEVAPPREDPHLHLDVRFLVVAPPGAALAGNHESEAIRWVRWDELAGYEPDDGLLRLAAAARERFRRLPR